MSFFSQFPKINYDRFEDGNPTNIVDIFRHVDLPGAYADDVNAYTYYEMKDGDRPDVISQKLYGTPGFYWTLFIVNDFLQAGFDNFYKDFVNMDRGIDSEYGPYGILTFIPTYLRQTINSSTVPPTIIPATLSNNFAGLDLSYTNLRIKKKLTDGTSINNWPSAKIKLWDGDMYQMVVYDFTDRLNFFSEAEGVTNEYVLDFDGTDTVSNIAFLKQFNEHRDSLNLSLITDTTVDYNQGLADLQGITWPSEHVYSEMIEAPARYYAGVTIPGKYQLNDTLSGYQALREITDPNSITAGNFDTYRKIEYDKNEARRELKVIRPEYIRDFAKKYSELINLT
tara:strand:- start:1576 stop:2592 length:1017 start_codon:yes stop_codon:yes gene_type:complete